jgi:hypothetical protein
MTDIDWTKLKTALSVPILHHIAEKQGMPFGDYCEVYDSEKHEDLLNKLLEAVEERMNA